MLPHWWILVKAKSWLFTFSAGSTHVVAVIVGGLSGPSDCFRLPWLSHQDWENICHSPLWPERQVKGPPARLVTRHTWVPPTTALISRQMEHKPPANWAAVRQRRPCQIVPIADVTSQSASPLCPTATPTSLPLKKKKKRKKEINIPNHLPD